MKRLSFFLLILFVGNLSAMEHNANSGFPSVMGQSVIGLGTKENRIIAIKEGTFFSGENKIVLYKADGTPQGFIQPPKDLGMEMINRPDQNNQFAMPYGNGLGVFDKDRREGPILEFEADEDQNPSTSMNFKFQTADNLILTKKAQLGNYTYFYDTPHGNPRNTFKTGYDSVNAEGSLSVSFDDITNNPGYARSFVPRDNTIIKSFAVPGELKMCTPDSLKLIVGRDTGQGIMAQNEVYDVKTGNKITQWAIDPNWSFFTEQPSQDSRYLAQVTDNVIRIYDLLNGREVSKLKVKIEFMPFGLWFSPDNQQLITVSNNSLGSKENKNTNLAKLGLVAHLISKEKRKELMNSEEPQEGEGMVNIWDINLEKPKEPKKLIWWQWPNLGLW